MEFRLASEGRLRLVVSLLFIGFAPLVRAQSDGAAIPSPASVEARIALPSWAPLVKQVLPAVVNIAAEIPVGANDEETNGADSAQQAGPAPSSFDDFLRRYQEQHGLPPSGAPLPRGAKAGPGGKTLSLGSAFIIDPAGYIVTNNHVVARATKITVIFPDNSQRLATVVGTDPKLDIALLKVLVTQKLPFLRWGDSDRVQTGDWVMTVGNPFGLGGTVTAGIVSALGRDLQQGAFDDFLQIDAPINHGSSGGPTFDVNGRVVGVNAAIYSPSGGNVGIGFAIPSNLAKAIVQNLRNSGHADHGYLGISVQPVSREIAHVLQMDPDRPKGLLVNEVDQDSPAEKAGIMVGDVITAANGHIVQVQHDLSTFVITAKLGDRLHITVDRNNRPVMVDLFVGRAPTAQQQTAGIAALKGASSDAQTVLGIWFATLTADMRRELQLTGSVQGVVIGGMEPNSGAAAAGLMPGDVVMSIDRQPVTDPTDAARKLRAKPDNGESLLLINRHGSRQFMVLPAQGKVEDN